MLLWAYRQDDIPLFPVTVTFYQNGKRVSKQPIATRIALDRHNPTEFYFGRRHIANDYHEGEEVECESNLAHVKVAAYVYRAADLAEEMRVHNPKNKLCPFKHYQRKSSGRRRYGYVPPWYYSMYDDLYDYYG